MKRIFTAIIGLASTLLPISSHAETSGFISDMKAHNVFNTIELAANIGTTGLGLEVASPMTEWAKLRVGFDCMPKFRRDMEFGVENYIGNEVAANFDRINEMMMDLTGQSVDRTLHMESKPTMTVLRFLVDVYPFKSNRHWHITAGFFVGGNSIGTTVNKPDDMASLMALKMYDALYRTTTSDEFVRNPEEYPLFGFLTFNKETAGQFQKKMLNAGQIGIYVGDNKDGSPCMLLPDEEGIFKMKTIVNRFRPYIGFGYGENLSKDGRWQASFDAGVQFWGGTPKLTANDGTVINDLTNLSKDTKSYIDLMKAMPVYPTLDFRISYRF
ncbi:MAG: hypothetical protein K2L00_01435 [Muribaculaceae bacterium]|nr:hypothetical protein [Muribaculaceae bacterium]